jgi:hypothetical protein
MDTVDDSGLPPHCAEVPPPTSSLPARQPNGTSHVGQPVPTYSTVLSVVTPHVVSVKVPPSSAVSPNDSWYTSREPG